MCRSSYTIPGNCTFIRVCQISRGPHVLIYIYSDTLPTLDLANTYLQTWQYHYCDVIIGAMASQITSLTIVYSTIHSVPDQIKHQSSASLAFVRGIHRWAVNSPHKWPVTRKMFPYNDVIMYTYWFDLTWLWDMWAPSLLYWFVSQPVLIGFTGNGRLISTSRVSPTAHLLSLYRLF